MEHLLQPADPRPIADMNTTPLIDVLLVLIIIFMVVVPQHTVGLPTALPQPSPADAPAVPVIKISLSVSTMTGRSPSIPYPSRSKDYKSGCAPSSSRAQTK